MKIFTSTAFLFLTGLFFSVNLQAQYPPPAGYPGTTAMSEDSTAFIAWASTCTVFRGFVNMADTGLLYNGFNKTTYGSPLYATGRADDFVVSLGDKGNAVLTFDMPVVNGPGPDFAVFENSFDDTFLELAFVEVSSDGQRFIRFPAVSMTPEDEQVPTFGWVDATKIRNLAGKYRSGYGTPFDLEELRDSAGINLNHITHIRIVDAGGCLQSHFASLDCRGHAVNDPWPTPFDTGGFDLDGIGVLYDAGKLPDDDEKLASVKIGPNPVITEMTINTTLTNKAVVMISDMSGRVLLVGSVNRYAKFDLSAFPAGVYVARISLSDGSSVSKKIVKN